MNQGFSKVLILVIVAILVAGGIFAWQYFGVSKNEITGWREYKSPEFGFEIKYPSSWFLYGAQQSISTAKPEEWLPVDTFPPGYAKIWWERTGVQTIDDIIDERFGSTTNTKIVSDSDKNVNGTEGREVVYTCKNCEATYIEEIDTFLPATEGKVIFFNESGGVIYLWLVYDKGDPRADYYIKTFNEVLSTIKLFIDQNETANWQTYRNEEHGFEIKYPEDTRISETSNYTIPALNTNKDIITAIQSKEPSYPRSLTGLSVYATDDIASCSILNNGKKITETKDINGITFLVYGENLPDSAMGGIRSVFDIYRIVYNNVCYSILSSVDWRDVSFMYSAIGIEGPSSQELEEQQNWIQTQQQLNEQILSTFRFIE